MMIARVIGAVMMVAMAAFAQESASLKVLSTLAAALSEGNPAAAMATFDRSMPGYEALSANIYALTSQADLTCVIDPIEKNGEEIEADWFLLVRSKQESGPTERRQVKVKISLIQTSKGWRITGLTPITVLDLPSLKNN
jgi:hypothetical protein